jgi:hypothetical protein
MSFDYGSGKSVRGVTVPLRRTHDLLLDRQADPVLVVPVTGRLRVGQSGGISDAVVDQHDRSILAFELPVIGLVVQVSVHNICKNVAIIMIMILNNMLLCCRRRLHQNMTDITDMFDYHYGVYV